MSNNTLDSFLAFWNAIEIAATEYHTRTERTKDGAINKVYQCFLDCFGDKDNWGVPGKWINDMHDTRSRIAHGGEETTAAAINQVAIVIPELSSMARKLIFSLISSNYREDLFEQEEWMLLF